jgi:hypothetical protein
MSISLDIKKIQQEIDNIKEVTTYELQFLVAAIKTEFKLGTKLFNWSNLEVTCVDFSLCDTRTQKLITFYANHRNQIFSTIIKIINGREVTQDEIRQIHSLSAHEGFEEFLNFVLKQTNTLSQSAFELFATAGVELDVTAELLKYITADNFHNLSPQLQSVIKSLIRDGRIVNTVEGAEVFVKNDLFKIVVPDGYHLYGNDAIPYFDAAIKYSKLEAIARYVSTMSIYDILPDTNRDYYKEKLFEALTQTKETIRLSHDSAIMFFLDYAADENLFLKYYPTIFTVLRNAARYSNGYYWEKYAEKVKRLAELVKKHSISYTFEGNNDFDKTMFLFLSDSIQISDLSVLESDQDIVL